MLKMVCDAEGCDEETPLEGLGLGPNLPVGWCEISWMEKITDDERASLQRQVGGLLGHMKVDEGYTVARRMRCCNKHLGSLPKPKAHVFEHASGTLLGG